MKIARCGLGGLLTLAALIAIGSHLAQPTAVHATAASVVRSAPESTATPAPPRTTTGTPAPTFQVTSLNAGPVRIPDARPTVVYFMSSACGSCISGEQQLATLAKTTSSSVTWLSLDVDPRYDTPHSVLAMAHAVGAYWPQAYGTAAILNAYHVTQLDMVAVIAKNGQLLYDGALPSNARLTTLIQQAGA